MTSSLENHLKENNTGNKLEVIKKYVETINEQEIVSCLEKTLLNAEKIGFGNNAEVFKLQEPFESVCVKVIKKQPQVIVNNLDEEFNFQQKVNETGIKTPKNLIKIKNIETGQEYMVMEKITGRSLSEILKDPNFNMLQFDIDGFFEKLISMVTKMHDVAKIHHRDLHAGNIMYNTVTMEPVIIDFGHATESYMSDSDIENIYRNQYAKIWVPEKGRHVTYTDTTFPVDNDKVKDLKKEFQKVFIEQRGLTVL